ncbi:hypothetical protein [Geoalkalibacter subterraneus]|uniref:Uncharacterized protein n=1 Tax=Geoalkalibacter subterraneus TaxID=483547 RepID=A0A0B5FG89_9BACT|nr:hypothetical protein [Geoalkalibacter subterraneus]AJF07147.1 hypothetical protein GSUB_12025 [Geoalkalibacter subterraneus]
MAFYKMCGCLFICVGLLSLVACGGSSSSRHTESATVTGGVVVDPYIVGATFFEDVNDNGLWDEGEQISTPSDERGHFTFDRPVPAGLTIIMHEAGDHQGLPYTGRLARTIMEEDAESVIVSPLTTLVALGLDEQAIVEALTQPPEALPLALGDESRAVIPGFSAAHINADPYGSLHLLDRDSMTDADLAGVRANVYVAVLFDFFYMDAFLVGLTKQEAYNLLTSVGPLRADLIEAVCYVISAEGMERIASTLPENRELPPVTMREVADTAPALFTWWKQEVERREAQDDDLVFLDEFKALVDRAQGAQLGLNYYVMNNIFTSEAVHAAFEAGDLRLENDPGHLYLREDTSLGSTSEVVFNQEMLAGKAFYNGALILFDDEKNGVEMFFSEEDDWFEYVSGDWWVSENGVLSINSQESNFSVQVDLVADWQSHLYMRMWGEIYEGLSGTMALPFVKVREQSAEPAHYIIKDQHSRIDEYFRSLRGGHLWLAVDGDDLTGELAYYPDSSAIIPIDWWIDPYGGLSVDSGEQVDAIYFINDRGRTVMISDVDGELVYDEDTRLLSPLLLQQEQIEGQGFVFSSSYLIQGEEQFEGVHLAIDGSFLLFHPFNEDLTGSWTYDQASGLLTLRPEASGAAEIRMWFVGQGEDEGVETFEVFYEEDDESGTLIESGFETLQLAEMSR